MSLEVQQGSAVRRVRKLFVVALSALLVITLATWWSSTQITSPSEAAAKMHPPEPSLLTADVEFRKLRQIVAGTGRVDLSSTQDITFSPPQLPDVDPLITRVIVSQGAALQEGAQLVEIAGRPVFLFEGATPMYRSLRKGDRGADVEQLQHALRRLGHKVDDPSGSLGAGTALAVTRFYQQKRYQPPSEFFAEAQSSSQTSESESPATTNSRELVLPKSEGMFSTELPAKVALSSVAVGQRADKVGMQLAHGKPEVRLSLGSAALASVKVGQAVTASLEDSTQTQQTHEGRVVRIDAPSAEPTSADSARPDTTVIASLPENATFTIGASVKASIVVEETAAEVLAVPVAAIHAGSDGVSYVQVRASEEPTKRINVRVGLSAGGYVEVVPVDATLQAGDAVVIGVNDSTRS